MQSASTGYRAIRKDITEYQEKRERLMIRLRTMVSAATWADAPNQANTRDEVLDDQAEQRTSRFTTGDNMHRKVLEALAVGLYLLGSSLRRFVVVVPAERDHNHEICRVNHIRSDLTRSLSDPSRSRCVWVSVTLQKPDRNVPFMESDNAESLEPTH